MKLKILTIFGTRPEAIKMAPIVWELGLHSQDVESYVCVTAQHREMLDQVLDLFNITPDYDLDLMQQNQTPTQVAARILSTLDPLIQDIRPDWILVQGDTTTVMAAAIAAHYARVRVGHVEAGLRSYDRENPFPEEMNRVIADHISDLHFAPTPKARQNLLREGIRPECIHVTGNTVIDAMLQVGNRPLPKALSDWFQQLGLGELAVANGSAANEGKRIYKPGKPFILVTAHRRENHGQPLRQICYALRQLVEMHPELHVVYPVHRNPNISEPVHELLQGVPRITLIPPVDYLTLVHLMKCSTLILTDSGGIQEEAPSLGVPVLVLRETTERPEAIEAGVAHLIGTNSERIISKVNSLLDDAAAYSVMSKAVNPYGDGRAGRRIVDVLLYGQCEEFTLQ